MKLVPLPTLRMFLLLSICLTHQSLAETDRTTVNITATVNAHTCTLTGSEKGLSFELPPVSVHDFDDTAGLSVGEILIPIVFSDCVSGINGVSVKVTGETAGNTTAFKNTLDANGSDGATGIGVNFYDTDGQTLISSGTDVPAAEQKFGREGKTLNYKASYTKVANEVKGGVLNTVLTINFTYI